ncbi:MAG: hypothetical protein ACRENP_13925 [Longimicrobiales bacterium]
MNDEFSRTLRLEAATNDVRFFKVHREVEHRDGSAQIKTAPVGNTIFPQSVLSQRAV